MPGSSTTTPKDPISATATWGDAPSKPSCHSLVKKVKWTNERAQHAVPAAAGRGQIAGALTVPRQSAEAEGLTVHPAHLPFRGTQLLAWIILFVAGLFEVGWAVGLKYTHESIV